MKTRKLPNNKLEKNKTILFQIGLILTLSIVLLAFEWKSPMRFSDLDLTNTREGEVAILPPITKDQKEFKVPEKPKPAHEFKAVANNEDVEEVEFHNPEGDENTPVKDIIEPAPLVDESNVEDPIVLVPEIDPEFPGGISALYRFLRDNLVYPEDARNMRIQGKVFVTFIIEKDGSVTHIRVLRPLGYGLDEEVVRVLKIMPRWKPGVQGGLKARVQYNLPVSFKLAN